MRARERIPLHDHVDNNSGGRIDAGTIVAAVGGTSGGPGAGGSGLSLSDILASGDFETTTEGGQSIIKAHGSMGATETFDPTDGNVHTGTLDANCTFTLNAPAGAGACMIEVRVLQDGTGGWAITWPGSVTWAGGTPSPTTTPATTTVYLVETLDGGTTWLGVMVGGAAPSSADYLVGTAQAGLSAEIVVGTTPGGELGGTWPSPTVDTTHSGSSHADAIATAEAYTDAAIVAAGGGHAHVTGETHLSDGSTTTYTLDEQFEPGSVEAFNTTTLAYLTVTETAPDQATVSAAGSSGDKITFSYAGSLA